MPWTIIGNIVVALLPRLIGRAEKDKPEKGKGNEKRSWVDDLILAAVEGVEGTTGLDVFNNEEVLKLYNQMRDSIVAFQNGVAKQKAKTPPAASEKKVEIVANNTVVWSTAEGKLGKELRG